MKEMFYEESAISAKSTSQAKKFQALHIVSIIFFVITAFLLLFSLNYVPSAIEADKGKGGMVLAFDLISWFSLVLFFALMGFVCWKFKKRYNVSFDYTVVEDEVRIAKVFNGKKRKFLRTLKSDQILKIGYCDSDSFDKTLNGFQGKPTYFTPNTEPMTDKMFIYLVYSDSLGKSIYILECRLTMLDYLVRMAGRNKLERK